MSLFAGDVAENLEARPKSSNTETLRHRNMKSPFVPLFQRGIQGDFSLFSVPPVVIFCSTGFSARSLESLCAAQWRHASSVVRHDARHHYLYGYAAWRKALIRIPQVMVDRRSRNPKSGTWRKSIEGSVSGKIPLAGALRTLCLRTLPSPKRLRAGRRSVLRHTGVILSVTLCNKRAISLRNTEEPQRATEKKTSVELFGQVPRSVDENHIHPNCHSERSRGIFNNLPFSRGILQFSAKDGSLGMTEEQQVGFSTESIGTKSSHLVQEKILGGKELF